MKFNLNRTKEANESYKQLRDAAEKACHYTNLQPLWSEDNLSKENKT